MFDLLVFVLMNWNSNVKGMQEDIRPVPMVSNCEYWFDEVDRQTSNEDERAWAKRVLYCESRCRSGVVNSLGYTGLMQWSPYYWSKQFSEDIFDGKAQIKNSLIKYRLGGKGLWSCK